MAALHQNAWENTAGAQPRLIMQTLTGSLVIKHNYPCHTVLKHTDNHIPHSHTHTVILAAYMGIFQLIALQRRLVSK